MRPKPPSAEHGRRVVAATLPQPVPRGAEPRAEARLAELGLEAQVIGT